MSALDGPLHLLHGVEDPPLVPEAAVEHGVAIRESLEAALIALAAAEAASVSAAGEDVIGHLVDPVAFVDVVVPGQVVILEFADAPVCSRSAQLSRAVVSSTGGAYHSTPRVHHR